MTKGLFLIYQYQLTETLTFIEVIKVFAYGFRMDMSATGYMLLLPGLALITTPFVSKKIFLLINKFIIISLGLFVSFITVLDFELYMHWGFRLDLTPLNYLGKEAAASTPVMTSLLLIGYWLVLFGMFYWTYVRMVQNKLSDIGGKWFHAPIYLVITAALLLPIRGSLDIGPMNLGFVYFHKDKPFANHAAINVFWNIGNAIYKAGDAERYPENMVNQTDAQQEFDKLYNQATGLATTSLLHTDRPNILLIILEGFTAKIIAPLGGNPTIAPHFNRLTKTGILFDHYYASGDRTDKGLISILSGFPAQPKTSIIKYAGKTEKLPKLSLDLKKENYHTSYVYGGDVNFANMNSYLNMAGFSEIIDKSHFNADQATSKWGVHDHLVFDTLQSHLARQQAPFFTTLLTLSSHEPFDVPMERVIDGKDQESLFLNAAHYTDRSLGLFIDAAQASAWWDNTLVVIMADHGNRHPINSPNYVPERFQIPMLWLGGALNVQDTVIHQYGSQTDLAATLLGQLQIDAAHYPYSKNLFDGSTDSFAYYVYNDGFGYIDPSSTAIYDLGAAQITALQGDSSKLHTGKSYMQMIYSDFNKK
jgi:phosphoglycerol transferase MdoB-like AlkP superfamily enzyme